MTTHPHIRHPEGEGARIENYVLVSLAARLRPSLPSSFSPVSFIPEGGKGKENQTRRFDSFTFFLNARGNGWAVGCFFFPWTDMCDTQSFQSLATCIHHAKVRIPSAFRSNVMHQAQQS